MNTTIQKWGNSLGIRIPSVFARDLNLTQGSTVEILEEQDRIIIFPQKENLDDLLSKITNDNIHSPIETGQSIGNEAW